MAEQRVKKPMTRIDAGTIRSCRRCGELYAGASCLTCPPSVAKPQDAREEAVRENGRMRSAALRSRRWADGKTDQARVPSRQDLLWHAQFAVPLVPQAHSKNRAHTLFIAEHIQADGTTKRTPSRFSPSIAKEARAEIADAARRSLMGHHIHLVQAKLWVDILVQKSSTRFDAANVLDTVLDGIRDGIGLDDRFYAIRFLDWEVVMADERMLIGMGQMTTIDHQFCMTCGALVPLATLEKVRKIARVCRVCRQEE